MGRSLAAFVFLALLAGCAAPAPPGVPAVDAPHDGTGAITNAGAYLVAPSDGPVSLAMVGGGDAKAAGGVYDASDRRVADILLHPGQRLILEGGAGLVLWLDGVFGTLRVLSADGAPVALTPLAWRVERTILAEAPAAAPPAVPLLEPPMERDLSVALGRTPASLRLLVAGGVNEVAVELHSDKGRVLTADSNGGLGQLLGALGGGLLAPVPARIHAENLTDTHLSGHLRASGLRGAIVLESVSYSRARPPDTHSRAAGFADAQFLFGQLPEAPAAFHVPARASAIVLLATPSWGAQPFGGGDTSGSPKGGRVALFGPDDRRIGTFDVSPLQPLAVPVARPGTYVAVLLTGMVFVGLDAVPSDFTLRELPVVTADLPSRAAGRGGQYAVEREDPPPAGVPFDLEAHRAKPPGSGFDPRNFDFLPCPDTSVRLDQDGEAIGFWDGVEPWPPHDARAPNATDLLSGAPLSVVHDGFGDDGRSCRMVVTVTMYVKGR